MVKLQATRTDGDKSLKQTNPSLPVTPKNKNTENEMNKDKHRRIFARNGSKRRSFKLQSFLLLRLRQSLYGYQGVYVKAHIKLTVNADMHRV